jgi:hypothetical protein
VRAASDARFAPAVRHSRPMGRRAGARPKRYDGLAGSELASVLRGLLRAWGIGLLVRHVCDSRLVLAHADLDAAPLSASAGGHARPAVDRSEQQSEPPASRCRWAV